MSLEPAEKKQLRKFLVDRFILEELKDLAFDLGTDYELFPHSKKATLARELIDHFEQRDNLGSLIKEVLQKRPDGSLLVPLLAKFPPPDPLTKKVQIIVTADLLEDATDFLDDFAKMLNCSKDEVVLIGMAKGSLRLLVNLPEKVVGSLNTPQKRGLADSKYKVISITAFDSLDSISRETWRFVICSKPPSQQGTILHPTVSWEDALKVAQETLSTGDTPIKRSDEEWIRQLKNEDLQSKKDLWEMLFKFAWGTAFHYTESPTRSEDISRDAAVTAYEKIMTRGINQYSYKSPFPGYCRIIVVNTVRTRLRKEPPASDEIEQSVADPESLKEPFLSAGFETVNKRLQPCLEKLTARESQVVEYYYFRGLEPSEAAKKLTISRNNFHRIAHRARRKLHNCLNEHGYQFADDVLSM